MSFYPVPHKKKFNLLIALKSGSDEALIPTRGALAIRSSMQPTRYFCMYEIADAAYERFRKDAQQIAFIAIE